ncbi:MAG: hypothetical protein HOQ13_13510 [Dermatophilaceae bacterium]|nr:hypothetical protein [Dermatophilaceae bacterium]
MGILDAPGLTKNAADARYAPGRQVTAPAGFALTNLTIPRISRLGGGRFYCDLDLDALRPAAGVTYYVAPASLGTGDCTSEANAGPIPTALAKPDVGTIIYAPGEYFRDTHTTTATTKSINHIAAGPGVKVTGWNSWGATTWTLTSGSIYQTTRSGTEQVVDVNNRTSWGDYTQYVKKADLASITGPGQWAIVGTTVYVWCIGNTNLSVNTNRPQIRLGIAGITAGIDQTAGTAYVRGIDFEGHSTRGLRGSASALILAEDCTFRYSGAANGLSIDGGIGCILRRCEASSNLLDGFNYHHTAGTRPDFIEVDCRSHHNGLGNPGSNNASTAHEDVRGIRVGGYYDVSGGPVLADVNSAKTWVLGSTVGQSTAGTGQDSSFRVDAVGYAGDPAVMWVDECTADGSPVAFMATAGAIHVRGTRTNRCPTVVSVANGGVVDYYTA